MRVERLETPALIIEEKIFQKNAEAMNDILKGTSLALRPHYKSHKCAAIARWQIMNGAKGMTCAKLSEALDLADSGIEDILIANQIVDPRKVRRLADLAGDCRLTVCVDDPDNVRALAAAAKHAGNTIHCLVEYDIGMERCGVVDREKVLELAECIGSEGALRFDGIQAYAGHISHMVDATERRQKTAENADKLRALLALLEQHGMKAETVSGGSTGTAQIKAAEGLYTELQAGSYLFMDATYRDLNLPFQNSLFLLSTVVSARAGLVVIDSGIKTCGVDQGMPSIEGGVARKIVDSEEHFQLHDFSKDVKSGDKVRVIPGHCCSTINLHDRMYIVDEGHVVERLQITGRGYGR